MLKKLLAGAVSLMLASALCAVGASAAKAVKGDVNGSGDVDIEDAVGVIAYVNGNSALGGDSLRAGDIDRNGVVDIEDAVAVIGSVNGTAPLMEDKTVSEDIAGTATAMFNADVTGAKLLDVEAEFNSAWDVIDESDGFYGNYMGHDIDQLTVDGFCLSSESFKSKSVKQLAEDYRKKMILDKLELTSEKQTKFNGYDAYTYDYAFHFEYDDIVQDYVFSNIFVKNDDKMMLVTVYYTAEDKDAVAEKVKPVLDSVKFTDNEADDGPDIIINRLNPFEDIANWGYYDEDEDDDDYERFYSFDASDWNAVSNFDNTLIFKCFDEHSEPPILNIYLAGRKSDDFKSKTVEDIAKSEFDSLNIGKDADIKILTEENTKFNGYDAYHYDIDYTYDEREKDERGIDCIPIHDEWNVDVYFVKQDDKVLVVVTTLPDKNEEFIRFSNEKMKPILDSIKLVP